MTALATGHQVGLESHGMTAAVAQVGAALRSLAVGGTPLLRSHSDDDYARFAEGQILAPWPNRLAGGTYVHAGARQQLPLSEPGTGHAIHGLARWSAWQVRVSTPERAVLALDLHPQAGYPFSLALEVEYALGPEGLRVSTTARNAGPASLPYGCGFHPYLTVGTEHVDDVVLTIPADSRLEVDETGIPTGARTPVAGTEWDFRGGRMIGSLELDTAFSDLRRDSDGRAEVTLAAPGGDRPVAVWMDAAHPYVMAFTADGLPEDDRRRSLAIEPMTCAPDAFNSGDGLRVLAPGESVVTVWGIRPG